MKPAGRLLPFVIASLGMHAAVLWCRPDVTVPPPAQRPGDAGVQLTLARPALPHAPATPGKADAGEMPRPAPASAGKVHRRISAPAVAHAAAAADTGTQAPTPEDPAPGPAAAARDAAMGSALQVKLLDALRPHFHYPLLARRRGWEGTVQIGLRVHADGHISELRIVGTSRYAVLDRAALESLERIGQLPGAVAWLNGRDSDIVLPVEYRLTDG